MKAIQHLALFAFILLIGVGNTQAQKTQDLGLWTGLSISKSVTDDLKVGVEWQGRFDENIGELNKFFAEFSAKYKLSKMFRVSASYRHTHFAYSELDPADERMSRSFRYSLGVKARNLIAGVDALDRWTVGVRLAGQWETGRLRRDKQTIRAKLNVDYNIPKLPLTPYVSTETFYRLNRVMTFHADQVVMTSAFNRFRVTAGMEWKFKKRFTAKGFWMFQTELGGVEQDFILGAMLAIDLKGKLLKKKKKESTD